MIENKRVTRPAESPRLEDMRPGSTWRHVAFGYLAVIDQVEHSSVQYSRIGPRSKFRLHKVEFVKAYFQIRRAA